MAQGDIIQTIPTGSVHMFPVSSVLSGFLECNGATISRTTYAALFAVLGITYGSGDGSTTFKIPDYRGEFIRGFDNGRGVDRGRALTSAQVDATAKNGLRGTTSSNGSHTHSLKGMGSGIPKNVVEIRNLYAYTWVSGLMSSAGNHSHTVTVTGDAETRPRNKAIMYCIKV